jgi:hypothetical protein
MRPLLILIPLVVLIAGCPRIRKGEVKATAEAVETAGWPAGYQTWKKVNDETLVRADDTVQVARELYSNQTPDLGPGAVLVKEEYSLSGGVKGALKSVAVMRRTGQGDTNGWEFLVYDGQTRQRGDNSRCVGCHVLQEDNDYLFSPIDTL